ncbi:PspA/IM30 family protein [bacterium]|nr:PspA/IM30 family protein [bacterium]
MTFAQRLRTIVRSWLHARRGRSTDTGKRVAAIVADIATAVNEAKLAAAHASAEAKRLERTRERTRTEAEEWARRATVALGKERDDLAAEAVKQEAALRQAAEDLQPTIKALQERATDLYARVQPLETRLTEARLRLTELRLREGSLEAAQTVQGVQEQLADPWRTGKFDELDQAMDRWAAEVGTRELMELDPMQAKLRVVDRHLAEIEQRLAQLRRAEQKP